MNDDQSPLVIKKNTALLIKESAQVVAAEQGIILPLDKSLGNSSFALVAKCRKAFGVKKIGHAGTLDPLATGVVVIAIGRKATKQIESFVDSKKCYHGSMILGVTSDTDDSEGPLTEGEPTTSIELEELHKQLQILKLEFEGDIIQVPPRFSARKVNGKRMYKMARAGEWFEPTKTLVTVDSVELSYPYFSNKIQSAEKTHSKYQQQLLDLRQERLLTVDFEVNCGKGTYIRSIVRDLGEKLGTGAFMSSLRRTYSSSFDVGDCWSDRDVDQLIDSRKRTEKTKLNCEC